MPLVGDPAIWADDTQQGVIRNAIQAIGPVAAQHAPKNCPVCQIVGDSLTPLLGTEPLKFYRNPVAGETGRQELPRGKERAKKLRYKIAEIHAYMTADRDPAPLDLPTAELPAEPEVETAPAPVITVNSDHASTEAAHTMIRWIQDDLRPFGASRNADGQPFDEVGLRPAQNAAKMLTQGIPVEAIKHALTLHYPAAARTALKVKDFDPMAFRPKQWGAVAVPAEAAKHSGTHKALPYVVALANAGVPIALVGPPGTGKTTLAADLATALGRDFGFVSMTRGTSPSAFNGRPKIGSDGTAALVQALIARGEVQEALKLATATAEAGDVAESEFVRSIKSGGVWLFDELDAAEPNLMLTTNAVLANRKFYNTVTGETIAVHPDWTPVAGMNTLGLGGDRKMTGRAKQDAAALDRWNAGRVEIKLDPALERFIFWKTVAA